MALSVLRGISRGGKQGMGMEGGVTEHEVEGMGAKRVRGGTGLLPALGTVPGCCSHNVVYLPQGVG